MLSQTTDEIVVGDFASQYPVAGVAVAMSASAEPAVTRDVVAAEVAAGRRG